MVEILNGSYLAANPALFLLPADIIFSNSTARNINTAAAPTIINSTPVKASVLKIGCRKGVYVTINCRSKTKNTAIMRGRFVNNPVENRDLESERMAMTCPIWLKHKILKTIVCQCHP